MGGWLGREDGWCGGGVVARTRPAGGAEGEGQPCGSKEGGDGLPGGKR